MIKGRKKGRGEGREAGKVDTHASKAKPMDPNRGGNAVASTLKMAMMAMAEARRKSESTGSCTERIICRTR